MRRARGFGFKFLKYKYAKRGEPEIHLIRHLVEPGTTAIDIGCSIGIYAAEMARYANKVIAFEANPAAAQFARAVVPRNVEVVNVALSSAAGHATLKIPRNPGGASVDELATIEPGNPLHASDTANVEVEMKRLDDMGIANCSFIKIDVEGHEEAVLDGAANLIAAQRPVLMIELDESLNKGALARLAARVRGAELSRPLPVTRQAASGQRVRSGASSEPREPEGPPYAPARRGIHQQFRVRSGGKKRTHSRAPLAFLPRLHHIIERAAARARRIHQHRHVSGRMLVLHHQLCAAGIFVPREDLAHARIDAAVEHELIGGACLLEVRESASPECASGASTHSAHRK